MRCQGSIGGHILRGATPSGRGRKRRNIRCGDGTAIGPRGHPPARKGGGIGRSEADRPIGNKTTDEKRTEIEQATERGWSTTKINLEKYGKIKM